MKRTMIVFANAGLFLLLTLMPCSAQVRPIPISQGKGQIEGTVVTEQRTPIANAVVYLFDSGRSPVAITDSNGNFSFKEVAVGSHKIIAYKESEGFPNMIWSFYSEAYGNKGVRVISVGENQSTRNILVRLGPKASRLRVSVIDANTKRSIRNAEITLNHEGKPKTLMKSGTNSADGGFDILIPPSVRIEMTVNAPGYRAWPSTAARSRRSSKIVSLKAGSEANISVELQPGP